MSARRGTDREVSPDTEPIDTRADLEFIVDAYRARWVIEEFFKALKTGCRFERRQLESYRSLSNALAIFLPIAVRLLALRGALERIHWMRARF